MTDLEINNFAVKFQELKNHVPKYLQYYFAAFFLVLFLLVFWIPANDYDGMSSYFSRIILESFGNLRDTATLEIQYTFPKFFDYLHTPFLKFGYFNTFPSFFCLCMLIGIIVKCFPLKEALIALFLILAAQPIIISASCTKNDFALGALAFFSWMTISYLNNSKWYLSVSLLTLCSLIGTKWQGFFIIPTLGLFLIYKLSTSHTLSRQSWLVFLAFIPAFIYASSLATYLSNLQHEGSLFPLPSFVPATSYDLHSFVLNSCRFIITNILDTFDVINYFVDIYFTQGKIWDFLREKLLYSNGYNYTVLPDSNNSKWDLLLLISLSCCGYIVAKKKNYSKEVLVASISAIFYAFCVIFFNGHCTGYNRYHITTYLLALIPSAQVIENIQIKNWIKPIFIIYLIATSAHALIFNQEKLLISTPYYFKGERFQMNSIFKKQFSTTSPLRFSRDVFYFNFGNRYFIYIYKFFKNTIKTCDSLLLINYEYGVNSPLAIYPFIKDRKSSNTKIINVKGNKSFNLSSLNPKYILTYRGAIDDKNYQMIYHFPEENMHIYERKSELKESN